MSRRTAPRGSARVASRKVASAIGRQRPVSLPFQPRGAYANKHVVSPQRPFYAWALRIFQLSTTRSVTRTSPLAASCLTVVKHDAARVGRLRPRRGLRTHIRQPPAPLLLAVSAGPVHRPLARLVLAGLARLAPSAGVLRPPLGVPPLKPPTTRPSLAPHTRLTQPPHVVPRPPVSPL